MKTWITILCLMCCTQTEAQSSANAKLILKKAVAAAGGETWQFPKSLVLKGDAVWTPHGKTDALNSIRFDKYAMYRVYPSENKAAHQANGKIRFDAAYGDSAYMQLIFDGQRTKNYLSDRAKPYQKHFSWSNNFGFGIIRFADRDSFQVHQLADDQVEGYPCFVIQIVDPKQTITNFFIDQQNYYIRSVAFLTDVGYHHRIYSDFTKADNVSFVQPGRVRLYFDGIKWMDIHWRMFTVNQPIEDAVFKQ